ncbi:MAG TPA: hypothetical protein GX710_07110 [Clostridiales bacterium]|nr:hypothetical protein [Clostridiales bacterium]
MLLQVKWDLFLRSGKFSSLINFNWVYSPVALVCIARVIIEVRVMLMIVRFENKTKGWFIKNEKQS